MTVKEAKAYWEELTQSLGCKADITFPDVDEVFISISFGALSQVGISETNTSPQRIDRSRQHIARDGLDLFSVHYVKCGSAVISAPHDVPLGQGEFLLTDNATPQRIRFHENTTLTSLHFPRAFLGAIVAAPEDLAFRKTASAWDRAVAATMEALTVETLGQLALPPQTVVEHIAALLALTATTPPGALRRGHQATLRRLRRAMRDRLPDPGLTPQALALEQGVSKRTLHALFAAAGTSFGKELIALRLHRARDLLNDRRYDGHGVAEIAALVGFANASHFGLRFRQAFGLSPAAYRAARKDRF
jgi:AraC-like DNA-binding protein